MQILACAFQQMKILRCATKKVGLILSQDLSPVRERRWQPSPAATLQVAPYMLTG